MKHFVVLLICFVFVLSGCQKVPSAVDKVTPSTTTTATTQTTVADDPQLVEGEALRLEDATTTLTIPLVNGRGVAHHYTQGTLLLERDNEEQAGYSLFSYDTATGTIHSLGNLPPLHIGSGSTCFSADGRYLYDSYIVRGDFEYLSVFRTDLKTHTTECIEKKQYGRLMYFLYAEGERIWRFWSEDPDNDSDASDFIRHIDFFDVATGESTELFTAQGDYNINAVCVADRTIYAIIHHLEDDYYSLDTFTLDGTAISSYDLTFLNETLGDQVEITRITVGGGLVFLTSSYAGQKVVLRQNNNAYQLIQGLSETETPARISGYKPTPSRNGFGYMFRDEGQVLIRYDEASNTFIEHSLPEDFYNLLVDEEGHLVIVYNDRIGGTATYYIFENISW